MHQITLNKIRFSKLENLRNQIKIVSNRIIITIIFFIDKTKKHNIQHHFKIFIENQLILFIQIRINPLKNQSEISFFKEKQRKYQSQMENFHVFSRILEMNSMSEIARFLIMTNN